MIIFFNYSSKVNGKNDINVYFVDLIVLSAYSLFYQSKVVLNGDKLITALSFS